MPYANSYVDEGTLSGDKVITFPWKPKQLQITNDSSTKDLKYKFNDSEDYRTLKPYETSSLTDISIRTLYLICDGDYRVWGTGGALIH